MHTLGPGPDAVLGEAMERLGHHLEVRVEVSRTLDLGEGCEDGGIPVVGEEARHVLPPAGLDIPGLLPAEGSRGHVGDHVCDEHAADPPLDLPERPVVEGGPGRGAPCGGVGEVIGHDLVGVDPAVRAERSQRPADRLLGERNGATGGVQVCGRGLGLHGMHRTARDVAQGPGAPTPPPGSQAGGLRPTTVTSGGRMTGSSPGSTPVRVER